jgi:hypothetical protein
MRLCSSCGERLDSSTKRYCSDLCRDEASLVRYARKARAQARLQHPDVVLGLRRKFASVHGGGYPVKERYVTSAVRSEVLSRHGGLCEFCRTAPATEVDHIDGSSSEPSNLRGLCSSCHGERTEGSYSEPTAAHAAQDSRLWARILSPEPMRACDDHETWDDRKSRAPRPNSSA